MPSAIDATVGGASANSFVTQAEAVTYCGDHLNATAFTNGSSNDQIVALLEATRWLNARAWIGSKVTSTQRLQWPRSFATDPDMVLFGWRFFDTTVIPQRVKDATCELALQFLIAGTTDIASYDPKLTIQTKRVDVLETTYFAPGQRPKGLEAYPSVMRFIAPLLTDRATVQQLVRA